MQRRQFLLGTTALVLAGCSSATGGNTVGDIIKWLQDNCNFTVTLQTITTIVAGLVAGFNAAAGAAAVVAADIAKQIEDQVCTAVKAQVANNAKLKSATKGASEQITVPVKIGDKDFDVTGIYMVK